MNKNVENIILFLVGILVIISGFLICEGMKETRNNRTIIGNEIIIFQDTLKIIDYNTSYGYFILNNGLLLNKEEAFKKSYKSNTKK